MISLDTNLLVRFIVQDDPGQSRTATSIIEKADEEMGLFVTCIVLCELVWVLDLSYKYKKTDIINVLEKLVSIPRFRLEHRDAVLHALHDFKISAADFSDCLLGRISLQYGCDKTYTFDKQTKHLPYFSVMK